jgi:hypothetical protein
MAAFGFVGAGSARQKTAHSGRENFWSKTNRAMLSARAIFRLLIENEQPETPTPDDPNQLGLDFNPDVADPKAEIMRYAETPFRIPGTGPTDLYNRLANKLHGRESKKVGNNTYVIRYNDRLAVRFHQTDVVTAYPDGKVVVETGGWRPGGGRVSYGWRAEPGTTTRDRINTWLTSGWHIFQKNHEWFWFNYHANQGMWDSDLKLPYNDGDTIFPDGSLQLQADPIPVKPRRRRT